MNRGELVFLARRQTQEALEALRPIEKIYPPFEGFRPKLTELRDELDATCRTFEDFAELDDVDQIYLPLFDSLAFLNESLRAPKMLKRPLLRALRALEHAQDEADMEPANVR